MTVQLERPGVRATPLRSPLAAGLVAAGWSAVLGLLLLVVLVLLLWAVAPHDNSSPSDALRVGGLGWLLAHHAHVVTVDGTVSLVPLGLVVVPFLLLLRSARWLGAVAVDRTPAALVGVGTLAVGYGLVGLVVAETTAGATGTVSGVDAMVSCGALAAVAGTLGVLSGSPLPGPRELLQQASAELRSVLRGAAAGLAVLLGGGALMLAGSLLAHLSQVSDLSGALGTGIAGGVALAALGLLALPNAVVWAAAYAVGPGFAVGLATSVAPAGVTVGDLPAFPLLGALPGTGPAPTVSLVALLLPVVAGVVVGGLLARSAFPVARAAGLAFAAGVSSGLLLGVLATLSAGSVGAVRMSDLGPQGGPVGLVAALEVGAVAAATAFEGRRHADLLRRVGAVVSGLAARLPGRGRADRT